MVGSEKVEYVLDKAMLLWRVPYFEQLLQKPSPGHQKDSIQLSDTNVEVFQLFMSWLTREGDLQHIDRFKNTTLATYVSLFVAAEEWKSEECVQAAYNVIKERLQKRQAFAGDKVLFFSSWAAAKCSAIRFLVVVDVMQAHSEADVYFIHDVFDDGPILRVWGYLSAFQNRQKFKRTQAQNCLEFLLPEDASELIDRVEFVQGFSNVRYIGLRAGAHTIGPRRSWWTELENVEEIESDIDLDVLE